LIDGDTDGDQLTDAALLRAHVEGDSGAFAVLVAWHQDRPWAIALRIMRDPEDAADALPDAYIAAFRRAGSYRGEAQVTTWLHRVVVNACLDRLRTMGSRETEPFPEDLDRWSRMGTTLIKDPMEMKEQRGIVAAALGVLNADQRAALVPVDMEGYSDQVAEVVADRLNKVAGIVSTETHIAFRAYSAHDLEAASRKRPGFLAAHRAL
jgi:RNA polymerase sigma-70 factor, ECF subfamily